MTPAERATLRSLLNHPDHVDKVPATVYHELLDEGAYVASVSTMYPVLREHGEVRERRRQATHPPRVKPELVATSANRVWSWDITKLAGPAKWSYFHLYVIIDISSRYVVGWLLADRESSVLAEKLLADTRDAAQAAQHQQHPLPLGDGPGPGTRRPGEAITIWETKDPPVVPLNKARVLDLDAWIIHTCGSDSNIGKKTAALQLYYEANRRGIKTKFAATGQSA